MIFKEKKDGEIRAISYCNVHTNFESILKLIIIEIKIESTPRRRGTTPRKEKKSKKNNNRKENDILNEVNSSEYWKLFDPYYNISTLGNVDQFFLPLIRDNKMIKNDPNFNIPPLKEVESKKVLQKDFIINDTEENECIILNINR